MFDAAPRLSIDRLLEAPRSRLLALAALSILITAWLDWWVGEEVTLGVLYILPIILLSGVTSRGFILGVAALCASLRLLFNPHPTLPGLFLNGSFALLAYGVIGLFAAQLANNRRAILRQLDEIRRQQRLRREAEEQLRLLAESSPAAIFTLDAASGVISANRATYELLGVALGSPLSAAVIEASLPVLAQALEFDTGADDFRTVAQVQGRRADGTPFLAQACFSTYHADDGSLRLAAIAFDSTEETREREEQSQHEIRASGRIIAGAVAHEVRNICGAMSVVYSNLEAVPALTGNRDFRALGNLLTGLGRLAHLELHGRDPERHASTDLRDILNQLRILIGPAWEEEEGRILWPNLPRPLRVAADSFTLLQAFLNIANNGLKAVAAADDKQLSVAVETAPAHVRVSFADSGPGVADPDNLFQPFRSGFGSAGIGLYISRALLRRYGGDVRYEPCDGRTRFIVEVPVYGAKSDGGSGTGSNTALAGR